MKSSYKTVTPIAVLTLLVVLVVTLSFWSFKQIETAAESRKHTAEIISLADELCRPLSLKVRRVSVI